MLAKSVVVVADDGAVLALVRGEHEVSTEKLTHLIGAPPPGPARKRSASWFGASPGSLGPVGMDGKLRIVADPTLATGHYVTGANRDGVHLRGVVLGRDFQAETADIRDGPGRGGVPAYPAHR